MDDPNLMEFNLIDFFSLWNYSEHQYEYTTQKSTVMQKVPTSTSISAMGRTEQTALTGHVAVPSSSSSSIGTNLQASLNVSSNSGSVKSITSKSTDGIGGEKKRISSSGRQKKFHRHFKQVPQDEEVLNCTSDLPFHPTQKILKKKFAFSDFSCAFVSDILLQGYMYITDNHIAFYSNVFGYITKLLIPVTSVTRISKEKTVKIIPNAIAVATADERHVFSSFLSREAAYKLMICVWKEALPMCDIELTSSAAQIKASPANSEQNSPSNKCNVPKSDENASKQSQSLQAKKCSNSGVSELDDESSSAISGNESLAQLLQAQKALLAGQLVCSAPLLPSNGNTSSSNSNCIINPIDCETKISRSDSNTQKTALSDNSSAFNELADDKNKKLCNDHGDEASISIFKLKIPQTIHIAYFGLSVIVILTLIAAFLFYRIAELKSNRFGPFSIDEFNKVSQRILIF